MTPAGTYRVPSFALSEVRGCAGGACAPRVEFGLTLSKPASISESKARARGKKWKFIC